MPGHFTVDLDLESLRAAQRWLGTMADEAPREAQGITGVPAEIGDAWAGAAADKIKQEMRDLAQNLRDFGPSFADARDAVRTFANAVDTFESTTLPDLNRRYDELNESAEADMRAADRRAENAEGGERPPGQTRGEIANGLRYALQGLGQEFEEAKDELRRKATAMGTALSGTSPIAVPQAAITSFTGSGHTAEALSTWPEISPDASSSMRVDVTPDSIDAFDFSEMTEEERREFNERNPGVLDALMREENPSDHLKDQVLALGTPQVDGEDARSDFDSVQSAVEDGSGQQNFLDGFASSRELNRYALWAQQHDGPPLHDSQVDYLSQWTTDTWDHRDDIRQYIDQPHERRWGYTGADGYHTLVDQQEFDDATKDVLRGSLGDSLLAVSDHRLGGGYDRLPEAVHHALTQGNYRATGTDGTSPTLSMRNEEFLDVAEMLRHGELMPGDGLAKQVTRTATDSLAWAEDLPWRRSPQDRDYPDDVIGDMLAMVGRNQDATTDILTGEDMPDGYQPSAVLRTIYMYNWDDDGAQAAEMTSWIGETLRSGDVAERSAAMDALDGLARGLAGAEGPDGEAGATDLDVFADLMDADGSDSAGKVNPHLIQALGQNFHSMSAFDALTSREGDPSEGRLGLDDNERLRLMMLISGDELASQQMAAASQQWANLKATELRGPDGDVPGNASDLALRISTLAALVDAGMVNEALERGNDLDEAKEHQAAMMNGGLQTLIGQLPYGASAVGNFIEIEAPEVRHPQADLPTNWDEAGGHLAINTNLALLRQHLAENPSARGDLPPILRFPKDGGSGGPMDAEPGALLDALRDYPGFADRPVRDFDGQLMQGYGDRFDHFTPDDLSHLIEFGD